MTADIFTLENFRRDGAGAAKIPTSKYEHHAHTSWQSAFVTLPDPLPKNWGEFWKASDFWWRRQDMADGPSPECWRRALISLQSKMTTVVT